MRVSWASGLLAVLGWGLAGCASTPPAPPDLRGALLRPCANAADWSPWLLVDAWDDGDAYNAATQFRDDGVMVYAYGGSTYDNGRWSIDGGALRFDTNNHYADYVGMFDGERGVGVMSNTQDNAGKWTLERACDG